MSNALRFLIVDDFSTMRRIVRNLLKESGFTEADEAEDGVAALHKLRNSKFDVIITDINMPRLDGFGLIERLRGEGPHRERPILVLTTESSEEKKDRARKAGATGWIVKPFQPDKLIAAVRRVAP